MDFTKNKVLTLDQACQYTGYKRSYILKLTSSKIIPHSKPNNKTIFFDREKLEAWMLSNSSTSQQERETAAATYITSKKGVAA